MKYCNRITIAKPLEVVIKKLDSVDNMKHWQEGLIRSEHISGTPGEFGARMNLVYNFGNTKIELKETITKRNLPHELHATYNTKGMYNIQQNYFRTTNEGSTEWVAEYEYLPTNFFMRMMTIAMPGIFKKESLKYMVNFKNFVEKGVSVANA
ncbi:SRPBCC family protein [Winogradskyella sp. UBA3174]|uniref:SRPBCC family protein n=1 Tax=Winogradskyella sp. UBA3174 TaxID=1947785 RepID=UPI0025F24563|nr:SRPBCC family protein [Winogradskyella sp. UBA3174]|tara:strand:- start:4172 stop:4627 length:456 start_codon:yes stop_codon:yes gene_type:complete